MPMQDWIHKYPHVQAMLHHAEDDAVIPDVEEDQCQACTCATCCWCPRLFRVALAGTVPALACGVVRFLTTSSVVAQAASVFGDLTVSLMGLLAFIYMVLRENHD